MFRMKWYKKSNPRQINYSEWQHSMTKVEDWVREENKKYYGITFHSLEVLTINLYQIGDSLLEFIIADLCCIILDYLPWCEECSTQILDVSFLRNGSSLCDLCMRAYSILECREYFKPEDHEIYGKSRALIAALPSGFRYHMGSTLCDFSMKFTDDPFSLPFVEPLPAAVSHQMEFPYGEEEGEIFYINEDEVDEPLDSKLNALSNLARTYPTHGFLLKDLYRG